MILMCGQCYRPLVCLCSTRSAMHVKLGALESEQLFSVLLLTLTRINPYDGIAPCLQTKLIPSVINKTHDFFCSCWLTVETLRIGLNQFHDPACALLPSARGNSSAWIPAKLSRCPQRWPWCSRWENAMFRSVPSFRPLTVGRRVAVGVRRTCFSEMVSRWRGRAPQLS